MSDSLLSPHHAADVVQGGQATFNRAADLATQAVPAAMTRSCASAQASRIGAQSVAQAGEFAVWQDRAGNAGTATQACKIAIAEFAGSTLNLTAWVGIHCGWIRVGTKGWATNVETLNIAPGHDDAVSRKSAHAHTGAEYTSDQQ